MKTFENAEAERLYYKAAKESEHVSIHKDYITEEVMLAWFGIKKLLSEMESSERSS